MKTLDEVIKALELCTSPVLEDGCLHGCPYSDLVNECACDYNAIPQMQKDALHYLKEYQEIKQHLACLDSHTLHGDETERRYDNGNLERY